MGFWIFLNVIGLKSANEGKVGKELISKSFTFYALFFSLPGP